MAEAKDRDVGRVAGIGGGLGGMAAALQLRAKGHAVQRLEKNDHLEGIAASFKENGVRGFYPLGFGDNSAYESIFELHGKQVDDYVE